MIATRSFLHLFDSTHLMVNFVTVNAIPRRYEFRNSPTINGRFKRIDYFYGFRYP